MGTKKIIVGIDPGTTLGYAVFDLDGNVIAIDSSKDLDLGTLISKIITYGNPVLVGTDKKAIPSFVEKFAIKTGAKIVGPKEDLLAMDKRRETKQYIDKFSKEHEIDAVASALLCFSAYRELFRKVDVFCERNGKEAIRDEIKELVVRLGINIRAAAEIIEKPDDESVKIIKKAVEKKEISERDYLELFSKLKTAENELRILRERNNSLEEKEKQLMREAEALSEKAENTLTDDKAVKKIKQKERRNILLYGSIEKIAKENMRLREEIDRMNYMVGSIGQRVFVKRLSNLGWEGFTEKNKILRLEKGDVLLVDDPNIVSHRMIEFMHKKVQLIITKKPVSKKITEELGFTFLDGTKMDIEESQYFATINRNDFEEAKRRIDVLQKIVLDYRRERQQTKSQSSQTMDD